MCNKGNSKEIDECLKEELEQINTGYPIQGGNKFTTLLSCCGHGRYPKTIIVINNISGCVFDWISGAILPEKYKNGKKRKRYYTKDKEGFFFLPEAILEISKRYLEITKET